MFSILFLCLCCSQYLSYISMLINHVIFSIGKMTNKRQVLGAI
uniref:Uncharacterized protein n=1 Tax=Rhizophora mucronata TaxID=61149 RepID=A0A2P2Q7L1_RHIMU